MSLYGGYCGLGGSKCVWYGTVITATGHIRGCGAYGDRHDTLPPGIQVYQYQQGTAKYGTVGYKAYQAPRTAYSVAPKLGQTTAFAASMVMTTPSREGLDGEGFPKELSGRQNQRTLI